MSCSSRFVRRVRGDAGESCRSSVAWAQRGLADDPAAPLHQTQLTSSTVCGMPHYRRTGDGIVRMKHPQSEPEVATTSHFPEWRNSMAEGKK